MIIRGSLTRLIKSESGITKTYLEIYITISGKAILMTPLRIQSSLLSGLMRQSTHIKSSDLSQKAKRLLVMTLLTWAMMQKGFASAHGSVVLDIQELITGDVNDGCDWATDYAINNNADLFVWDGDGLGVSLKRQVSEALDGKRLALKSRCSKAQRVLITLARFICQTKKASQAKYSAPTKTHLKTSAHNITGRCVTGSITPIEQ